MVKASTRSLKVYQTQFGFYDTVVAASSQAAALRAWEIRQNLFSTGLAKIATDPQAVEAARAHPEIPLRRAAGSSDPFVLEPTHLPTVPEGPKDDVQKPTARSPVPRSPPKPPPNRSLLDTAEADLRKLEETHARQEADLRRRQDELDTERAAAHAAYIADRKAVTEAIKSARQRYREAGGKDEPAGSIAAFSEWKAK